MNYTMERWYQAVGQRFSMRRYAGAPADAELDALRETAEALSVRQVRLVLCRGAVFRAILLGSGKVTGTDCFAAVVETGEQPVRCGYIGESFALECTALGLGTCFLGGTYKKSEAAKLAALRSGERLACIIALGKPGEGYIGRPRKSLDQLTGLSQAQLVALPEWQQAALSCARLAPSAVNGQPWRFTVEEEALGIYRTGANFGYGKLDQGIAMLHMELGAAHGGMMGAWAEEPDGAVFHPAT